MVSDFPLGDLPILTEVLPVSEPQIAIAHESVTTEPALPRILSTDEMQQLLQKLETHLETVFTSKLNTQLKQLQQLAVDLAVSEFKAELPQLLSDALKNRL